jgi:hypothetical protein
MAKYSGIVDLSGTIGNLTFYKRKGVRCVRRPGGFTRERLQTDPGLRRVVEHNSEFGAQSMASKSLRTALSPIKNFCDGSLHNRLMRIGARVTALTEGVHGQRSVAFSRLKPILNDLQLNADRSLESSLSMLIKSEPSPARNSSRLQLDFQVPVAVTAPKGTTHFRLMHALAVTSDIEYEPALDGFIPVAWKVDGLSKHSHSEYISLKEETAHVTFETTLPAAAIPDNATVVEVVGIDFYQALGTVYEPFRQGRAAMVVGVF